MITRKTSGLLVKTAILMALSFNKAQAADLKFSDIMTSLSGNRADVVVDTPDRDALYNVANLQDAAAIGRVQNYTHVMQFASAHTAIDSETLNNLIGKRKLTIVVVPGLLGEFIDTRAFEEVFARNSSEKAKWAQITSVMKVKDPNYNLGKDANEMSDMSELVNVASVDDATGKALVKVVILRTKKDSMESIGSMVEKAAIFNRRLQKYAEMSGDKDLVLLGYSRGTPLALEMIAQAENQHLSYLNNVKSVVSYAGVVFGSSLADLTDDPTSESGRQFAAMRKLVAGLQTYNSWWQRPAAAAHNTAAIAEFGAALIPGTKLDINSVLNQARVGDFGSVTMLAMKVINDINANSLTDFNGHVVRVKKFLNEIMSSVADLKTANRVAWFESHTLPKSIKYYSISAAMVDPAKGGIEQEIYNKKIGYNDGLDDRGLEDNRRTYEKATGFALNDSQVALHQSVFLPKVIANLNSANTGLDIEALGMMETHHWGVSLQVVNAQKDGAVNPFPRENVLKALAAYLNQ